MCKIWVLIMSTVFSRISKNFQGLLSITLLIIVAKIHDKIKPYKNERFNKIEHKSMLSIGLMISFGLIYEYNVDKTYPGFLIWCSVVLVFSLVSFIVEWIYICLKTFNTDKSSLQIILQILASILLEKTDEKVDNSLDDKEEEVKSNEELKAKNSNEENKSNSDENKHGSERKSEIDELIEVKSNKRLILYLIYLF